jgi:hypothetical protein
MRKILHLVLLLIFFFVLVAYSLAEPVDLDYAVKVGMTHLQVQMRLSSNQKFLAPGLLRPSYSIGNVQQLMGDNKLLAYVLELNPEGYIVVSPDTDIHPIIAYSLNGKFTLTDTPDNVLYQLVVWDMENRLDALPLTPESLKTDNNMMWNMLLNQDVLAAPAQSITQYGPWLQTTWDQVGGYNKFCPCMTSLIWCLHRAAVGCTATSMAQIINYWKYPRSVQFSEDDRYLSTSENGEQIRIDEDADDRDFPNFQELNGMLSNIQYNGSEDEIAALCFACGISLRMNYSEKWWFFYRSSGAYLNADAYRNKFGYASANLKFSFEADFYDVIQENMKNKQPIQISIYKDKNNNGYPDKGDEGHAIVVDGFKNTGEYHLNFGWSGSSDDWYFFPPIETPAGYNLVDLAIVNIYPYGNTKRSTFRSNSYMVINNYMTWLEAESYAELLGGHLVTIGDEEENRFVSDLALKEGIPSSFWIGLTDKGVDTFQYLDINNNGKFDPGEPYWVLEDRNFVWVTNEPLVYTNWYPGEPPIKDPFIHGSEEYVEMGFYGPFITLWNVSKNTKNPFVIEFEGNIPIAEQRTMRIISMEASPGAQTKVQISINEAVGITSGDITVGYDPNVLSIVDIKPTNLTSSMSLTTNTNITGQIKIAMAGTTGIVSGNGSLVDITMTVNVNAKDSSETILHLINAEIYDELGKTIPIILEDGTVKVKQACIKGDVNGDGNIKSNDATLILRIAAGLLEPNDYQKCAADFNGDGKIASNDAMLVLRKAAGLEAPAKDLIADRHISISLLVSPSNEEGTKSEAHGLKGEIISVPITVDNIDILSSGDMSISYDSKVLRAIDVLVSPSNEEGTNDGLLMANNISQPGLIRISFAGVERLNDVKLAEIKFEVLTDDVSPLTFKMAELYSRDALPLISKVTNKQFRSWAVAPERSALLQNYPNPFNPETWIPYQLHEASEVVIRIHNVTGELVREIRLGYKPVGQYTTQDRSAYWDGRNEAGERVSSGVYFYNIQAGKYSSTMKMIVTK